MKRKSRYFSNIKKKKKGELKISKSETEQHILLKKIGKEILHNLIGVPKKFIFEEFPIGNIKFDVIAYPTVDKFNKRIIIGVECGNISSGASSTLERIRNMLKFCHRLIWIPYDFNDLSLVDLKTSVFEDVLFIPFFIDNKLKNIVKNLGAYQRLFNEEEISYFEIINPLLIKKYRNKKDLYLFRVLFDIISPIFGKYIRSRSK